MTPIPIALVNMNYCLPAPSGANGSCRGLLTFLFFWVFFYYETVNSDYIYDSLWCRGASSQPRSVVLLVFPIASNWTGLMEQDGTRLLQSLQRERNELLEPQFNITDKQKRCSWSVTYGASLLFSIYRPGLCCLSARTRIISATHTQKIQGNARLETCAGLGVLQQEVEDLRSPFCWSSVRWRNNCWHYSFCLWFVRIVGRGVKGGVVEENNARQFIHQKSASAGSDGVFLSLIDCRPLRKTDGGTVTEKRHLNGWNG